MDNECQPAFSRTRRSKAAKGFAKGQAMCRATTTHTNCIDVAATVSIPIQNKVPRTT